MLVERFGFLELRFAVVPQHGGLRYRQLAASIGLGPLRVPLPRALAPMVEACEDPAGDDRVAVDVRVTLPGAGVLLTYRGEMRIEVQPS